MIGIRREDKNVWERRVPLTPDHVSELIRNQGLGFIIQPSERRVFPDVDYARVGAVVNEDLAAASLIVGVKEIPVERLLPGKAYLYFSHTTKAQAANMPALRRLLDLGCTLLDYERVHDERGRRLMYFGKHAGYAGMVDALWALGKRLAAEGHVTPFERVRLAHDYTGLDEASHHLSRLGEELRHTGLPEALRPLVFGFTGSGNVAQGALEMLERLPTHEIAPERLADALADPDLPRNIVHLVRFRREDRREGRMERHLPHLNVLVHGAFWDPSQPRLISRNALRRLWAPGATPKLRVIADISCDIDGAIEATVEPAEPGEPVYVYDPETGEHRYGVEGHGPVVLAVDNLPCQFPAEASGQFGDGLSRYMPALDRCDWSVELDDLRLPEELRGAVIVHRGRLTPEFAWLRSHVGER